MSSPSDLTSGEAHRSLALSEIFGPTFQGEGPSLGRRCAFIRLARCNLTCEWCDTPYTWDWERFDPVAEISSFSVHDVLAALDPMGIDTVVLTGGEPLLQQSRLHPLLRALQERGWTVEIETNGTLSWTLPFDLVTQFNVSPKLANSGLDESQRIQPDALRNLQDSEQSIFKFAVGNVSDLDEIAGLEATYDLRPIWIMPLGTTPGSVIDTARSIAGEVLERGWNLTTRLHILLWNNERGR